MGQRNENLPTLESTSGTNYFRMSIGGNAVEFDNWVAYGLVEDQV